MVSIIIPVYNVENYIDACVKSVLRQTHEDIEVLLVDDGSSDQSGEKCDKWATQDSRIKVFHQENQGLSGARNTGIEECIGDWITFVDSDDIVNSRYVEAMLQMACSNQIKIVQCGYCHFSNEKMDFDNSEIDRDKTDVTQTKNSVALSSQDFMLSQDYCTMAWAKLYARELFEHERFPIGKLHEDNAIVYKLIYNAKRIAYTNEILYGYRVRQDSIVGERGYNLRHLDKKEFLKERVEFFAEREEKELTNLARKEYAFELLEAYGKVKKYHSTEKSILQELKKEYCSVADEVISTVRFSKKTATMMKMAKYAPEIWMKVFGEK